MAMTGGIAKLLHTGIPNYGAATNYPVRLYAYYRSVQDQNTNKSTVYVGMYVVIPSSYPIGPWTDYNGSYIGTTSNTFDGSIAKSTGTIWLAQNKTFTVAHNSDGTAKATIYWHWGVNSPWGQFENKSGSFQITLPTIPRASTIGATDANIGAKSTIVVSRKSTAYTHSIAYEFGGLTGYITADGGVSTKEVEFTDTSISWTVPTSFYAQIPNAKTGTCTLTIKTYSGTTQIGDAQTDTFTVTASKASCAPVVSGTVEDSNETTKALTGGAGLVRYKSTALCTIAATAKNSATISQRKIGGVAVSGTTRSIAEVEAASVDFYALDSRGYATTAQVVYNLIPYVLLTCNPEGKRTDPTSGNAVLTIKGDYYNGSFGAADNTLSVKYRIQPEGGEFGDYIDVEPSLDGNSYSATVDLSGLDYKLSHTIEIVVADAVESVTKTTPIGRGIPVFDWGKEDFRINVALRLAEGSYGDTLPETGKKGQVFLLVSGNTLTIKLHNGVEWI